MIKSIIQLVYDNTIREYLPRRIKVYNGVSLNIGRLFDTTIIAPHYKQGTIDPLRKHTNCEDRVVVIGGGTGVSAVVAARQTHSVTVYEGGSEYADQVRATARLNRVEARIDVREAIVGENIDVYGESLADSVVPPSNIASCDVLEMDCEGAEEEILRNMEIYPRVIIVESHPSLGVDPQTIRSLLTDRDYEIVSQFELNQGNITFTGIRESN